MATESEGPAVPPAGPAKSAVGFAPVGPAEVGLVLTMVSRFAGTFARLTPTPVDDRVAAFLEKLAANPVYATVLAALVNEFADKPADPAAVLARAAVLAKVGNK